MKPLFARPSLWHQTLRFAADSTSLWTYKERIHLRQKEKLLAPCKATSKFIPALYAPPLEISRQETENITTQTANGVGFNRLIFPNVSSLTRYRSRCFFLIRDCSRLNLRRNESACACRVLP